MGIGTGRRSALGHAGGLELPGGPGGRDPGVVGLKGQGRECRRVCVCVFCVLGARWFQFHSSAVVVQFLHHHLLRLSFPRFVFLAPLLKLN